MKVEAKFLSQSRWRHYGLAAIAAIIILVILGGALFPWAASAYYLERGGEGLRNTGAIGSQLEAAEEYLQRALAWDSENAQACRLLAQLYRIRGDRPAVVRSLAHYMTLRPQDPLGYWELAMACEKLGDSQLGLVAGMPCGQDETDRPAALVRLWTFAGQSASDFTRAGDEFLEAGSWDQAETYYQRALIMDPEGSPAWFGLGEVSRMRGDNEAAMERYARVIALGTDLQVSARAHGRRGDILAGERLWDEARAELAKAVELVPGEGVYHLNYGWYLFKADGDVEYARSELLKAMQILPQSALVYLRLGDLAFATGDYPEMLSYAEEAVSLQPALYWSWVSLGRARQQLGQLVQAEEALRRAVELAPNEAVPHAELGNVLRAQGRLEEAVEEYGQAIALGSDNAAYYVGLAKAYQALGQISLARDTYRRVLTLDPDNAIAKQALEELGE